MLRRKNKNLHVVRDAQSQTDQLVERIMEELNTEGGDGGEKSAHRQKLRKHPGRKILLAVLGAAGAAAAVFLLIQLQTYTKVRVADVYGSAGASDGRYCQFSSGVLKYSRDGISYLNQRGEEQWNHPYQLKTPFVWVNDESGAVADKGGNDICVFQKDGIKGEIHTTLPIEKMTVSTQGIVCAVLKDGTEPVVICYDTAGNELVEHRTSLTGTGCPLDMSISPDGELLQGVYLYTKEGKITSRVVYYNFGEAGENRTDHQVFSKKYDGTVMAAGFFLSQKYSAVVGDNLLTVYKGETAPEEVAKVKIDKEIKSVFHSKKYIGLVLKNEGKGGYELRLYNTSGKMVMSREFTGDYSNIKMCGGQIIMYEGKRCSVFMRNGVQKFQGEMDHNIFEIYPVIGVNKYIVINANGMEHIRFVK